MMPLKVGIKNSQFINLETQQILDGFQNAYAYEVIRLVKTRPLFLDLHYNRLQQTCNKLQIHPPDLNRLQTDIQTLVHKNHIQNNNIKIAVDQSQYAIFPIPSKYPTSAEYLRGVRCSFLFEERKNPEIKAFQSDLRKKSNEQMSNEQIYESVLVNQQDMITEGSRSNLFFIKESHIITAPDQLVLGGITRLKVLEICKSLKLQLNLEALKINDLDNVDAAFICGTSPGVLPISNIGQFSFDPQNQILQKIHRAYHQSYLL